MDTPVLVALVGLAGAFISGITLVVVALINRGKEKQNTAESALEKVLNQRIILKDETISDLRVDLVEVQGDLAECRGKNATLRRENAQLRANQKDEESEA